MSHIDIYDNDFLPAQERRWLGVCVQKNSKLTIVSANNTVKFAEVKKKTTVLCRILFLLQVLFLGALLYGFYIIMIFMDYVMLNLLAVGLTCPRCVKICLPFCVLFVLL